MNRLRMAILRDVREDLSEIGEFTGWHKELVAAFNAVPGVAPITDAELR